MTDRTWPRVSLIMICFNQEQFVEAAIEAAFAQDYPNLQIVLSDDGSKDRTLEIARRLATEYRGSHEVIINARTGGEGVLAHLYDAVAKSDGGLIVVAASDDISHPRRVSKLVEEWQRTGASALMSRYRTVDELGRRLPTFAPSTTGYELDRYFPGQDVRQIAGAASAYDRRVFEVIRLPDAPVMPEDYFFSLMLALRSQLVVLLDEELVDYRRHAAAISAGGQHLRDEEAGAARTAGWTAQLLRLLKQYADDPSLIDQRWGKLAHLDRLAIDRDRAFFAYMARWLTAAPTARFAALFRHGGGVRTKWLVARLFGLKGLELLRALRAT